MGETLFPGKNIFPQCISGEREWGAHKTNMHLITQKPTAFSKKKWQELPFHLLKWSIDVAFFNFRNDPSSNMREIENELRKKRNRNYYGPPVRCHKPFFERVWSREMFYLLFPPLPPAAIGSISLCMWEDLLSLEEMKKQSISFYSFKAYFHICMTDILICVTSEVGKWKKNWNSS